ncbi:Myotubularin-related protein 2, variant 3 [Balamuthia mandrillaris]
MAKKRLDKIYETIRIYAFPGITKNLFAFDFELPDVALLEQALLKLNVDHSHLLSSSSPSSTTPGQQDYVRDDLARLGVPNDKWRLCDVNSNYAISDTYPSLFAVPASVSDNVIIEAATFRSKGRLPILSWIHPSNSATITRSSQPLVGMKNHRSKADEKLIRNIATSNSTSRSLCILDARPKVNAAANKAKGAGYEHASTYNNSNHTASDCQEELSNIKEVLPAGAKQMVSAVEFLGIDNIHVMRESERKLRELCVNSSSEDRGWFSDLENTRWLDHINLLLVCTKKIVENIQNGVSVFVHCSDGWDRTSQLTSLAMLCLDPYYRTMEGFATLIEREWLATGHKFSQRYGHGNKDYEDKDRAPIFPQFIDCVWQLQHQFPTLFEFNENYLLKVLDGMYSCQFGTFLYNCEKERKQAKVREQTVSLWQMIQLENKYNLLANSIEANGGMNNVSNSPYMFLLDSYNFNNNNHHNFYFNEHYDRTQSGQVVSTPMVGLKNVKLWNSYFLRFCQNVRGINSSFLSSGEHSASATSGQGPSLQTIRNIRASQGPSAFAVPSVLSPRDKITASAFASHRLSKEVSSMNNVEELKALVRTLQEEHEESIQLITQRADASIELLKKQKNETLQKYLLMNSFIAEERKKIKFLRSLLDKHGISFSKEDFQSWTQENEDGVDCDEEEGDWFDFIGSVEEEEDEETDETDEETDTGNDTEDEIISQVRRRKREMTVIRRELELSRNRKASPPDDYAELLGGVDDVGSGSGGSRITPTAQWQGGKVDSPRTSSSGVATKKSKPPLFVAGAMNHGNAAERVELSLRTFTNITNENKLITTANNNWDLVRSRCGCTNKAVFHGSWFLLFSLFWRAPVKCRRRSV